jgi:hypothetical protein
VAGQTPANRRLFLIEDTSRPCQRSVGIQVALEARMLKLIGSYAIAKLLGFGLIGAVVIYALLTMLS